MDYNNYLQLFKKNLWDTCIRTNLFNGIDQSQSNNVKNMFDNIIENYKTQILQNDNNSDFMSNIILNEFQKQIQTINKTNTREERLNSQTNVFNTQLEKKTNEFNELMNNKQPESPNFSDNIEEPPLTNENLENLINQQLKERENFMNKDLINNNKTNDDSINKLMEKSELKTITEENQIISNVPASEIFNTQTPIMNNNNNNNNELLIQKINNLQNEIENINNNLKILTNIMPKLLNSQISILQKIK